MFMTILYRRVVTAATLGLMVWVMVEPAAAQGFVPGTEDVPLMAGLEPDDTAGMSFDTPSGRIVVTVATGDIGAPAVRDFYRKALPALGWTARSRDEFVRGGEVLKIENEALGRSALKVTFTLSPGTGGR